MKIQNYAWAWEIKVSGGRWLMCNWAVSSKEKLEAEGKPSPEARAVRVELIPVSHKTRRMHGYEFVVATEPPPSEGA